MRLICSRIVGVYDVYQQSVDVPLKESIQLPVNDPLLLVSAMAAVTKNLGFGLTANLTYEPPYLFARRMSTLDHLSGGRVGWNIVTGYLDSAAKAAATAESAAAADLTLAGKQAQDAKDRADAARKKLAGIPMPADGDPVLMALRTAIADMRSAAARQVTADAVLRARRAARTRNAAIVAALAAQGALAQASAKAEETSAARRSAWQLAAQRAAEGLAGHGRRRPGGL